MPVHIKQVLTYLRFLGLLMNFSGDTFKEGLRRVVNHPTEPLLPSLRIHRPPREA